MLSAQRAFNKNLFDTHLRQVYYARKKDYKKHIKFKSRQAKSTILTKLNELESINPKEYWNLVNSRLYDEKKNESSDIPVDTWQQHFTPLFKNKNNSDDKDIDNRINNLHHTPTNK
ncbi:hypothetical protein SNE40_021492 [Patella caerulea]|uniref:Uncharacterized protein n=1 Tax=Patella caerulea TaxID=87958 RepID=A0AAN8FZM7_PATCE